LLSDRGTVISPRRCPAARTQRGSRSPRSACSTRCNRSTIGRKLPLTIRPSGTRCTTRGRGS
jgi:hypothetical protein